MINNDLVLEDRYFFSKKKRRNKQNKSYKNEDVKQSLRNIFIRLVYAVGIAKGCEAVNKYLSDNLPEMTINILIDFGVSSIIFAQNRKELSIVGHYIINNLLNAYKKARSEIDDKYISTIILIDSQISELERIAKEFSEKIKKLDSDKFKEESEIEFYAEMLDNNLV